MNNSLRFLIIFCLTVTTLPAFGQVQWATSIQGVSSRFNGVKSQYTPEQALGKPDKLPATGGSPTAWSPSKENDGVQFIKVGFSDPKSAQQIGIGESFNPGTITQVILFDYAGGEHIVYENVNPGPVAGVEGRMFNIFFPLTDYEVKSAKIVMNTAAVPGFNHIDAIGISDLADTIKATINTIKEFNLAEPNQNLGAKINSPTDELLPVIAPNGKTLYITRQSHPNNIAPVSMQDIYYSELDSLGEWSEAKNIGAPLNNGDNNALASITPDGQRALLLNKYNADGTMSKGLSLSEFNGTSWNAPTQVIIDDYYNDNQYGEYCLSTSGQYLVMSIERKDSEGSKDMYVCFKKEDGTWTAPKSLGPLLNTPNSETSPFISADERTLYFSSNGHAGYGSNDMFLTHRLDSTWTNWSEPENLGSKINTSGWDAYFSIPANGEYAYYISYSNSLGGGDVFRQKLPKSAKPTPVAMVRGRVLHSKTGAPLKAKVTYKNLTTGELIGEGYSDALTGKFEIALPAGFKYAILAEKEDFYAVNETIDLTKLQAYEEVKKDLLMVPIEVGEVARLNNLFFDTNKSELKGESFTELNQLVRLLQKRPSMAIEITGHTDDVGELAANQTLSEKRALSVYNYLISKGIDASRLRYKGYGESKPLSKNLDDAGRQLNRRVEFIIIAK